MFSERKEGLIMQVTYEKTAREKNVLIVEDHEPQRLTLEKALKNRGFQVRGAGDVATARRYAREMGTNLDVMVLDMRLEDPAAPNITGADLGIEVRSAQRSWPPEFLINSAYEEVDYLRLALRLGVAAYLRKEDSGRGGLQRQGELHHDRLVRHVRVLALRHALSIERPDALEIIRRIAETCPTQSDAVTKFCQRILGPELDSCLGAPFALFLTVGEETRCCVSTHRLPEEANESYEILQALAQGKINLLDPFVLDKDRVKELKGKVNEDLLVHFEGAAFLPPSIKITVPLSDSINPQKPINRDIHLSLAILKEDKTQNPLAEEPVELAKTLAEYLRPTVIELVLHLLSEWTEISSRRKAELKATSQFCLTVGQRIESLLSEPPPSDECREAIPARESLYSLADELRQTGERLMMVAGEGEMYSELRRPFNMKEIVELAAGDLVDELPTNAIHIHGECEVNGIPDDCYSAASGLLQWFANRTIESGKSLSIQVACIPPREREGPMVIFEDQSRKLSKQLREQLFDPFSQAASLPTTSGRQTLPIGLYVAKRLVETRNGGALEDLSDQVDGDIGHRFVMHFPPAAPVRGGSPLYLAGGLA
jgi:CheY-like chemotaxis protein